MTNDLIRPDEEEHARRTAALLALNWIITLAQLDYRNQVSFADEDFDSRESAALVSGEMSYEDIKADRELMRTDFRTFILRGMETQAINENVPTVRSLPTALSQNIRDQLAYDVKTEAHDAHHRENDSWYSTWSSDHNYKPEDHSRETAEERVAREEKEQKEIEAIHQRQDKWARNFGWADLPPSGRILWATEARALYENGEFYIKTADETILPAWEHQHIEKDGKTLIDRRIDNRPLSVDQTFYNEKGALFYYNPKHNDFHHMMNVFVQEKQDEQNGIKKKRKPIFTEGTPKFRDITDEALLEAIDGFMADKATRKPVMVTTLITNAAPLLKGLAMPDISEEDLKDSFWEREHRDALRRPDMDGDAYANLEKDPALNEKLDQFLKDAENMTAAARNAIIQKSDPTTPKLI